MLSPTPWPRRSPTPGCTVTPPTWAGGCAPRTVWAARSPASTRWQRADAFGHGAADIPGLRQSLHARIGSAATTANEQETSVDLSVVAPAIGMFAVTDVDDLVLLTLFFGQANGRAKALRVVAGQYLGFLGILATAVVGAAGASLLPASVVAYLGLLPLGLGIRAGWKVWSHRHDPETEDAPPWSRRCRAVDGGHGHVRQRRRQHRGLPACLRGNEHRERGHLMRGVPCHGRGLVRAGALPRHPHAHRPGSVPLGPLRSTRGAGADRSPDLGSRRRLRPLSDRLVIGRTARSAAYPDVGGPPLLPQSRRGLSSGDGRVPG